MQEQVFLRRIVFILLYIYWIIVRFPCCKSTTARTITTVITIMSHDSHNDSHDHTPICTVWRVKVKKSSLLILTELSQDWRKLQPIRLLKILKKHFESFDFFPWIWLFFDGFILSFWLVFDVCLTTFWRCLTSIWLFLDACLMLFDSFLILFYRFFD